MKNIASFLLILLLILLVACQDAAPEATAVPEPTVAVEDTLAEEAPPEEPEEAADATAAPEPTEVPTEMPAEESAPEPTEEAEPAEEDSEEEPMEEAVEEGDTTTNISAEQLEMMAAIAPPPQLSDRELGIHSLPCDPKRSPGIAEIEGEDYYCGVFTVPQNWDEPDGGYLDLAFVVANATGENPLPDPLVYLSGGPGQSAVQKGIGTYQQLRPDRDILRLDQRGAGFSQRLSYEECLVLALQNGAPADQIAAVQETATNPFVEDSSPVPLEEQDIPVVNETCWEQFTAQGLDPNQFNTANSARDIVEFVKALEYESFNIHGISYGTRLAMAIMDNMPQYDDALQLRSVVLDSTFPPSIYLISSIVRSDHDFLLQILQECREDDACSEAYPNLDQRLATLLAGLEDEPLTASGETVTLDDVVSVLNKVGATQAAYLPKMITELETGVLDTYLALRDRAVGTSSPENYVMDLDTSDPVQSFIADALDFVGVEGAVEFSIYLNFALADDDPQAALQTIIQESFPGESGDPLLQTLATLTADDFAASPYVLQSQASLAENISQTDPDAPLDIAQQREFIATKGAHFLYNSIHCREDIQFETFEDAVNSYNDLEYPQLTNLDQSQVVAGQCENWPVAAAPDEVKDPVISDVPALILQGAYDMATPVYMGQLADSELANSTYVLVPQQGHEIWTFAGDCVGQIATAYVQDPDAEHDLSCLEARQPQWALPDDGES